MYSYTLVEKKKIGYMIIGYKSDTNWKNQKFMANLPIISNLSFSIHFQFNIISNYLEIKYQQV